MRPTHLDFLSPPLTHPHPAHPVPTWPLQHTQVCFIETYKERKQAATKQREARHRYLARYKALASLERERGEAAAREAAEGLPQQQPPELAPAGVSNGSVVTKGGGGGSMDTFSDSGMHPAAPTDRPASRFRVSEGAGLGRSRLLNCLLSSELLCPTVLARADCLLRQPPLSQLPPVTAAPHRPAPRRSRGSPRCGGCVLQWKRMKVMMPGWPPM